MKIKTVKVLKSDTKEQAAQKVIEAVGYKPMITDHGDCLTLRFFGSVKSVGVEISRHFSGFVYLEVNDNGALVSGHSTSYGNKILESYPIPYDESRSQDI